MKVWRSILALVLLSAACTTEPARRAVEAAPSHRLELALSYAPGDSPTEQRIEKLQEQLRTEVSLEKSLMLAQLFMMRRRETSAPILMTYAQDAVDAVLAMAPNDHRGRLLSAMIHQYEHRFAKAEEIARAVIATHPEKPDAYHLLGDAQLEVGRYEQAIAAYQAAMDRRPDLRAYNRAAYMTWLHGDAQS
ncbi:MAG: tetratricopeptide repeat protein, partial [Myxococcota bacterium]